MTKKLLGLAILALFCAGMASATTYALQCVPGATQPTGGAGSLPSLAGFATCPTFVVPAGQTLTQVDLQVQGDFSAATGTLNFTYQITTSGGTGSFATTGLTEGVTGVLSSSNFTWVNTGGSCTNPTGNNIDDCNTPQGLTGGSTYSSITVSAAASWAAGSSGFTGNNGSEIFNVFEIFTYSNTVSTPEPASLLMIGGGLIGLAVVARRKRRA